VHQAVTAAAMADIHLPAIETVKDERIFNDSQEMFTLDMILDMTYGIYAWTCIRMERRRYTQGVCNDGSVLDNARLLVQQKAGSGVGTWNAM
jgi:hypothetical protein